MGFFPFDQTSINDFYQVNDYLDIDLVNSTECPLNSSFFFVPITHIQLKIGSSSIVYDVEYHSYPHVSAFTLNEELTNIAHIHENIQRLKILERSNKPYVILSVLSLFLGIFFTILNHNKYEYSFLFIGAGFVSFSLINILLVIFPISQLINFFIIFVKNYILILVACVAVGWNNIYFYYDKFKVTNQILSFLTSSLSLSKLMLSDNYTYTSIVEILLFIAEITIILLLSSISLARLQEVMTNEYHNRLFNLEYRRIKLKIYAYGNSILFAIAIFVILVDIILNKEPNNDNKIIYIFTFYLFQLILLSVYYIPYNKSIYDYIDIRNISGLLCLLNNYKVNLPQLLADENFGFQKRDLKEIVNEKPKDTIIVIANPFNVSVGNLN